MRSFLYKPIFFDTRKREGGIQMKFHSIKEVSEITGIGKVHDYSWNLELKGYVFRKKGEKRIYDSREVEMLKRMKEIMQAEENGIRTLYDAAEMVLKEVGELRNEKEFDSIGFMQGQILNELDEIKKIMSEMYINQQKKAFINLNFCKKTKK